MYGIAFWVSNPGNAMGLKKIVGRAQAGGPLLRQCRIGRICVVGPEHQFCAAALRAALIEALKGHEGAREALAKLLAFA